MNNDYHLYFFDNFNHLTYLRTIMNGLTKKLKIKCEMQYCYHHSSDVPLEMSNRLIRPVPSRTAAGSSLCGSRRVRPARAAVSKRSSQARTANCTLLYRLSRGTYVNVMYPIMLDTAGRSRTLPDAACCSKMPQAAPLHNQVHIINIHEMSTMQILQNL